MPEDDSQNTPQKWTRYQRVKEILNQAAGTASPSYQGYGKFWELPLPEFLTVVIYGVRMIAPAGAPTGVRGPVLVAVPIAPQGSCCHAPPPPPSAVQSSMGRGAASGLIIGLKGQCPFDGTQFPRLPWDGQPVSASDIQFIQNWIDDGCPPDDAAHPHVEVNENSKMARARGDEAHPQYDGTPNDFHHDAGTPKIRRNVALLKPAELRRFQNAVAHMKSFDAFYQDQRSFGYWARIHANLCQHGWEEFLPWHRAYLYFFEQQLQDIDPTVTLPYWDWPGNATDDLPISIFDEDQTTASAKTDNGVIPEAYRCYLTPEAIQTLATGGVVSKENIQRLQAIVGTKFNSGLRLFAKAGITYGADKASDAAIVAALASLNPLWDQFRWPGGDQGLIFATYPTQNDVDNILTLPNFFDFGSGPTNNHFFGALENIHNLIHNFSGGANPNYISGTQPENRIEPQSGDMVFPGLTAYDPIFWGHHSNVDRLWSEWQNLHPGKTPDNATSVLPPWTLIVDETYSIANLGYEYMSASHIFPTDNTIPIAKFKSANANVHPDAIVNPRRVEVRLHKVQYVTRPGFHIRVFLNSPQAEGNTPTRGNDHYVGQVNTFTGFCVGGPGHCDVPQERHRKFDRRGRPHKTPGNFRLDATDTVAKLVAKGETDFHVNLVVLNTDGTPATDALHLDAVSLNFID